MTRGTYWRCAACGFACDKDDVCPDCGYHTLVQEDFPERTWVGLTPEDYNKIFEQARTGEHAVQLAETKLRQKNT